MKKKIVILSTITFIIILSFGVTYSWLSWNSKNDKIMNITIGNLVNYEFKTSNIINTNSLAPVIDYEDGELIEFTLRNRETKNSTINMYLSIDKMDIELKNNSFRYKLLSSKDNNSFIEINEGNFSNLVINQKFYILQNENINNSKVYYKLYLYIDGNMENNNNMMNKSISGILNFEIERG